MNKFVITDEGWNYMMLELGTELKNDAWFWRWVYNRAPIDNDPRGDLIKLVQKLNATGTRPGVLPSIPDLTEHREAVERLWNQYDREQQEMKASEKAFDAEYEDDVPPDPYM